MRLCSPLFTRAVRLFLVIGISFFCLSDACAQRLMVFDWPSSLRPNVSAMKSNLTWGRSGLQFFGSYGPKSFDPNTLSLLGSFAWNLGEEPRSRGWAWGFVAQRTNAVLTPELLLVPTDMWELSFGRALGAKFLSRDSGIRGFFEGAIRQERRRNDAAVDATLTDVGRQRKERGTALYLRTGAATDPKGEGFVDQGPSFFSYVFGLSLVFPFFSEHASLVGLDGAVGLACGGPFLCYLAGEITQVQNVLVEPLAENVRRRYSVGPQIVARFLDKYRIETNVTWAYFTSMNGTIMSKGPSINISMGAAF